MDDMEIKLIKVYKQIDKAEKTMHDAEKVKNDFELRARSPSPEHVPLPADDLEVPQDVEMEGDEDASSDIKAQVDRYKRAIAEAKEANTKFEGNIAKRRKGVQQPEGTPTAAAAPAAAVPAPAPMDIPRPQAIKRTTEGGDNDDSQDKKARVDSMRERIRTTIKAKAVKEMAEQLKEDRMEADEAGQASAPPS